MKKRGLLLGGVFAAVSVLAFLAGRASRGHGPLADWLVKDLLKDDAPVPDPSRISVDAADFSGRPKEKYAPRQPIIMDKPATAAAKTERNLLNQYASEESLSFSSAWIPSVPLSPELEKEEHPEDILAQPSAPYVLSTNTRKFHRPTCREVQKIRPQHYATARTRKEAVGMKCSPCQRCKP